MTQSIRDQLQATLGSAYTLERELGGGGMSRVFVAEETALRRKVAVKVLPPELTAGVNVERFNREILVAAKLQHPHIVPVLTAGETGGLPYYTMPFVEGESLRARLGRAGALPITEAVSILKDVARALAFAHERGIVHRDIKPDNVLITGGSATVTDFGIAKAISASRTKTPDETLTQIGTSIGTPIYMSPEQAAGDPDTDHRADIYSYGCMAYELLTGQPPFTGKTPRRLLAAHMGEMARPVSELRPDAPPALADLVMRCLAKEAGDRPQQASDLVSVLETVTSSGSSQAMPAILLGGPGMFRKALAAYAAAFVIVAVVAKAAIVGIGLPDWVFPGALIVMALGLPVVLWTGYVHRVARRSVIATPTFTPGGTPATRAQGTIATMALKAAPHVSWYRTVRGGAYAMGAFIAVIGAFMAMRAFGIGPFGSLLATGALSRNDMVVFTDFSVTGSDTSLGRVVSDAVRAGLTQSSVMTIMAPEQVATGLRRMQRPTTGRLDVALARTLAQREGAKAVLDGDVTNVGGSFVVAVRLITADSGRELTSFRATASGPDKLIDAADQVARQLRGKAGESLKRVQGTRPLAQVTTASLEALRRYSEASRLAEVERDNERAEKLLREAVSLDTGFAEAWRKLGVTLSNMGERLAADSAIIRAYQLRERLAERERDLIVAYYFISGPGRDRGRGIAAYESMLARGDSQQAVLNNLALAYVSRREYARAESLYRAQIRLYPTSQLAHANALTPLDAQGKWEELDSAIAETIRLFPRNPTYPRRQVSRLYVQGRIDALRAVLDSMRDAPDTTGRQYALNMMAGLKEDFGQFKEAEAMRRQARRTLDTDQATINQAYEALAAVNRAVELELPYEDKLRDVEAILAKDPFKSLPPADRPLDYLASTFARAKRVDRAREYLAQWQAALTDTALKRANEPGLHSVLSEIALAEGKWNLAAEEARKADRLPDGPAYNCVTCLPRNLFRIYAVAGMADSAIAQWEQYKRTPEGSRPLDGPDLSIPASGYEALARMYEMKGDTTNAVEAYRQFVERWKDADPEVQPRVKAARERLRALETARDPG